VATTGAAGAAGTPLARRLRDRRRQLGFSQTELAGDALSSSYVSLLEAGKRTPTAAVLEVLAERLSCSTAFLLHGQEDHDLVSARLTVTYAELALRNGESADALDQLERVQATLPAGTDLHRLAQRLKANALEGLGRLEEAVTELESLAAEAESTQQWTELLRLTIDLVRCYQEAGDVEHGLEIGRRQLARVDQLGLRGSDVHAELASTVIGGYYVRGDVTYAGQLAKRAIADVEARGSARARAATYWNSSLVAEAAGNLPDALVLAQKALALYADGDDQRALARLRVAYGWLLIRTTPPQPEAARDVLEAAYAALRDVGSAVDLAYCDTELGRCAQLLGRPDTALDYADHAAERLGPAPRLETAVAGLVRAAALLGLDRRDEAVEAYRSAAGMLGALELSRLAAGAWRELADAFARLGLHEDAGMAYQQALAEAGVPAAPDMLPVDRDAPSAAGSRRRGRIGQR
jgi:tetratricopeptide (TPR) repeat protein